MCTVVSLVGLECYGYHGVSDAEQEVGHRFRIDVDLGVEESASESDDVAETVDYGAIAVTAMEVFKIRRRTVERVAAQIADALLTSQPRAVWAEVSVEKIAPPIPYVAERAGVRVRRDREK